MGNEGRMKKLKENAYIYVRYLSHLSITESKEWTFSPFTLIPCSYYIKRRWTTLEKMEVLGFQW